MNKLIAIVRDHFTFTTDWYLEPGYFDASPFRSSRFRGNTIAMACAVAMGLFVLYRSWHTLPWDSRWLLLVSIVCIGAVWWRTIRDHWRVSRRIQGVPRDQTLEDVLKAAAGASNFASYVLYIVAFALIVALGLVAKSGR